MNKFLIFLMLWQIFSAASLPLPEKDSQSSGYLNDDEVIVNPGIDSLIKQGEQEIRNNLDKSTNSQPTESSSPDVQEREPVGPAVGDSPIEVNNDRQLINFLRTYFRDNQESESIKEFLPKLNQMLAYLKERDPRSFESIKKGIVQDSQKEPSKSEPIVIVTERAAAPTPVATTSDSHTLFVLSFVIFVLSMLLLVSAFHHFKSHPSKRRVSQSKATSRVDEPSEALRRFETNELLPKGDHQEARSQEVMS